VSEASRTVPTLFDVMYAAGLYEGEGSTTVQRSRGTGRKYHSCYLQANVSMVDLEPMEPLHEFWGGRLWQDHRHGGGLSNRPEWRPIWRWTTVSRQAAAFLTAIRPHIRSVRIQTKIDLGLALQAQKRPSGGYGRNTPELDAYRLRQQEFFDGMARLNLHGSRALTSEERLQVLAEVV